jgi:hypothetical protein
VAVVAVVVAVAVSGVITVGHGHVYDHVYGHDLRLLSRVSRTPNSLTQP